MNNWVSEEVNACPEKRLMYLNAGKLALELIINCSTCVVCNGESLHTVLILTRWQSHTESLAHIALSVVLKRAAMPNPFTEFYIFTIMMMIIIISSSIVVQVVHFQNF